MRFPQQSGLLAAVLAASASVGGALEAEEASGVDQVFNQQASSTTLLEGPASGAASTDGCRRSQCCTQSVDSWLADVGEKPLLSDLRGMQVNDCLTISVGGELRHRYMNEQDRLRPGGPGKSTYDLWRVTPWLEMKYGDSVTGYVQAIDASIFNEELPVTAIDENRADLLQYYIDANIGEIGDGKLNVRVGRQFLKYGSQHLVSPLGWSNTFRNFEGIRLYYTSADWNIDGFWTRPVNGASGNTFRPTSFDHPDASRNFSGLYSTYKGMKDATLDLYWLLVDEDSDRGNRIDGERHTFGARYDRKTAVKDCCGTTVGTWAFELEGAFQVGEGETFLGATNEDIGAGMIHSNIGYTWNQAPWTPTIKGVFYWGSGDSNPGDGENTNFDTLFPLGHAYWGIIDNLDGSNLFDYSIQGIVKPTDKLTVAGAIHWFEKDEAETPIFNVAGAPFPGGPTTTGGTDIGTEFDLIATYAVSKTLQVQFGYSWFWYGDAIGTAAAPLPRDDATQLYVMTTWSF